jgi:hypothetical protein
MRTELETEGLFDRTRDMNSIILGIVKHFSGEEAMKKTKEFLNKQIKSEQDSEILDKEETVIKEIVSYLTEGKVTVKHLLSDTCNCVCNTLGYDFQEEKKKDKPATPPFYPKSLKRMLINIGITPDDSCFTKDHSAVVVEYQLKYIVEFLKRNLSNEFYSDILGTLKINFKEFFPPESVPSVLAQPSPDYPNGVGKTSQDYETRVALEEQNDLQINNLIPKSEKTKHLEDQYYEDQDREENGDE